MAALAGPQNQKEDARKRKKPAEILKIPEDTDRDPKKVENWRKDLVLCHLIQKWNSKSLAERWRMCEFCMNGARDSELAENSPECLFSAIR